jgi:hypothetical protein
VPLTRPVVIGLALFFLAAGYFLLVHNGKYLRIAKSYDNETPAQRKRRFLGCVVYAAVSFVSFFWLVQLRNS